MDTAAATNLGGLLRAVAARDDDRGMICYPLGNTSAGRKLSYRELLTIAQRNARIIANIEGFTDKSIVLIHLTDHTDNIIWLWSVILAGGIATMSTPFTNLPEQRKKHITHLHTLLNNPICITRQGLLDQFADQDVLKPITLEHLTANAPNLSDPYTPPAEPTGEDLALLMLTSGSTGNAKAVRLTHGQLLASVRGKVAARKIPEGLPFLNWIGFDHVASVTEIHLHAMIYGASQVHVQAPDMIANPISFLNLINKHRVGRSFAPNFFLAKLKDALESTREGEVQLDAGADLSCLHFLVSGGEANVTDLCRDLTKIMSQHGGLPNVIAPGFGMTETCAGSIYNLDCPRDDLVNGYQFCSLGSCVPGIEMRVTTEDKHGNLVVLGPNQPGALEVTGPIVFKGYFNNEAATAESFSSGWFRTGDQAILDSAGHLVLVGRVSEVININGVKHLPNEIDAAIEDALIPGVTPSFTISFSHRPKGSHTEQIFIVYLPSYEPEDTPARIEARNAIVNVTLLQTGSRPNVLPLNETFMQKTSLGKLSRTKIRATLERGDYKALEEADRVALQEYNAANITPPQNETERVLHEEFCESLDIPGDELGIDTPIFEMGVSSIHIIRLKRKLELRLDIPDIPLLTVMTNPSIRSLANALENLKTPKDYEPIVTLSQGSKTPIWLFHPGVGEVLVFLGLAKFLPEYPVYALRARGFEPNQDYFENIEEAVSTYYNAIKSKQPEGPYAMAGYSYGAMLAFETAKRLEANGDEVAFMGSFNLPPHIAFRMQQLEWVDCLLHLCYFLDLISAEHAEEMTAHLQQNYSKEEALAYAVEAADPVRMGDLAMNEQLLGNWADLAFGLQSMARNYEPSGSVASMDIFVAVPLKMVAANKDQWIDEHLSKWGDFTRSSPQFHDVNGEHYTMIGEEHVLTFQKTFRKALESRGL